MTIKKLISEHRFFMSASKNHVGNSRPWYQWIRAYLRYMYLITKYEKQISNRRLGGVYD